MRAHRIDDGGVSRPDQARHSDGKLLGIGQQLGRSLEVGDICERNAPLHI